MLDHFRIREKSYENKSKIWNIVQMKVFSAFKGPSIVCQTATCNNVK